MTAAPLPPTLTRVATFEGGRSGEHAISRVSASAIAAALARLGLEHLPIVVEPDGSASWPGGAGAFLDALQALRAFDPHAVFIAMHGEDGEDGRIQGALDLLGVPYQGSGVAASALALDKARSKALFRDAAIPVADDVTLLPGDPADWAAIAERVGLPCVLKTAQSGSSVGVEVVETADALAERGAALRGQTAALVVERWLPGRELTVPVLEHPDGRLEALPLIEIRPKSARFFDYEAKYVVGATDELCPAPVDDALRERCEALGLAAHRLLGCAGLSRTDLKCDADGAPRVLETNTLPGFTPTSLFPQAADAVGVSFDALVAHLLTTAVAGHARREASRGPVVTRAPGS